MDISELVNLTNWIEREIKSKRLPKLYAGLSNVLQHNAANNQPAMPFAEQLENLLQALRQTDLAELNQQQLEFLGTLSIRENVGARAIFRIEDILFKNSLDISTASQKIQEMQSELLTGIAKSDQIRASLSDVTPSEPGLADGLVMVRVSFEGDASIDHIVSLRKWANEWYDIGRGLAIANGVNPEEIRIVGARKGSIIFELAVVYGIAKVINKILLDCLGTVDRVLDLLKKVEELKGMKLKNKQILAALTKEAEDIRSEAISDIAAKTPALMQEGVDGEKVAIVEKSVRKLVKFLEKGGQIDCVVPQIDGGRDDAPDAEKIQELRDQIRQIRVLEKKRELLGHLTGGAANDDSEENDEEGSD